MFTISLLSVLPVHTPTTRSGVYPIVQLSRKSLVVPVLAAAGKGSASGLSRPIAAIRAASSSKISLMRKATRGSSTCSPATGGCSKSTSPLLFCTCKMATGATFCPSLAKTPYAAAMSNGVTSPPPNVSDSPYALGSSPQVVMPSCRANSMNRGTPMSCSVRMAGTL